MPGTAKLAGLNENLRFLILEVRKQLEQTARYLLEGTDTLRDAVRSRDDYIDTLRAAIQGRVFGRAASSVPERSSALEQLRAIDVITSNLERIGDFCEDIVRQADYITNTELLRKRDFSPLFAAIGGAFEHLEPAVIKGDVHLALEICRVEFETDKLYRVAFHEILRELESGVDVQPLVTILFIYRYLERTGDALLNIGEAVISMALGERIRIDQFFALEDSLRAAELSGPIEQISLEGVGQTRSGCTIDRVHRRGSDGSTRSVIFKEGAIRKLLKEKQSLGRWETIWPGLVPKVYSFNYAGDSGSMLVEFLEGQTFDKLLLLPDATKLDRAIEDLGELMTTLWTKTRTNHSAAAGHLRQLSKRFKDVMSAHPEWRGRGELQIGELTVPGFKELLERTLPLDARLVAPFSVFIHGDLNVDNIICGADGRLHFIDVYRSGRSDYVQDVSVFLVSNLRLQVFQDEVRRRIQAVVGRFYEIARDFASNVGDTTFSARLCAGVARSLATSTRFVLDESLARDMLLRARYLLEALEAQDPQDLAGLRFPEEVLLD